MIAKGTGFRATLRMISLDGAPDTSAGAPSVTISQDGGAVVAATNSPTQIVGTHLWTLVLTNAEANGDVIDVDAFKAGDMPYGVTFYTENVYTAEKAGFIDTQLSDLQDTIIEAIPARPVIQFS